MRTVRITKQKRHIEAEDGTILWCPLTSSTAHSTAACTDQCAWFRITEEMSQDKGGRVYARCGDRIIGVLKEPTNENQS